MPKGTLSPHHFYLWETVLVRVLLVLVRTVIVLAAVSSSISPSASADGFSFFAFKNI